jgi:coenzyme F420 biosynthesis associated uncharacterized protein
VSAAGIVDWRLAERVGIAIAGEPAPSDGPAGPRDFGPAAVEAACREAAERVADYTGLARAARIPAGEAVDRPTWVRSGLRSLREVAGGIDERLAVAIELPGPLAAAARGIAGAAAGAEAGAAVGFAGRRVLGQYDVSLVDADRAPRLVLVEPNLAAVHAEVDGAPGAFLSWVATHEVTHAAQFTGVPWLRDHLAGELRALLDSAADGIDAGRIGALARRLVTSDPRRTIRSLFEGELATALAGPAQRERIDRLQATMALIEGYAEHVMDSAEEGRRAERAALRDALERRRRSRSGLGEVVARLLGLELKLRQYRLGKAFADAVVAAGGIEALNRAFRAPDAMPEPGELERPEGWLERTAPVAI